MDDEELMFREDDVASILQGAIKSVLADNTYQAGKVNDWLNSLVDLVLKDLNGMNKPFKYVVTCVIQQKFGTELDSARSCYWDLNKDGCKCVKWTNMDQTFDVILTVYGISLSIDGQDE